MHYTQGLFFFFLHLFCSISNDILLKFLHIPISQIIFLRYLFAVISIIPFIIIKSKNVKTNFLFINLLRGAILFIAMRLWIYGLTFIPVVIATSISFTIPIFTILLSIILLKEQITIYRIIGIIISYCGILILIPSNVSIAENIQSVFLISIILFAILDIINKKYANKEDIFIMCFYSYICTLFLSLPEAIIYWEKISFLDLILTIFLGISSNVLLIFLILALSLLPLSYISIYRYAEIPMSFLLTYMIFDVIPNYYQMIGMIFVLVAMIFVLHFDKVQSKDL